METKLRMPTAVDVSVKGAGRLGLDNGDSTDFDQYKGNKQKAVFRKASCDDPGKNEPP